MVKYNDKKLNQDKAKLIHASGFLKSKDRLTTDEKIERFERQNSLNSRTKVNMLHISLNFDPSEEITTDKMVEIAEHYMKAIGFENQPYLVYEHKDSGHPHMHIVTSAIRSDGTRIDLHNLAKRKSEPARKEIEEKFGLVKAGKDQGQGKAEGEELSEFIDGKKQDRRKYPGEGAEKLDLGNDRNLKERIGKIVSQVAQDFYFESIAEFNAALRIHNVYADQGEPGSKLNQNKGIVYYPLDEMGKKGGVGIKGSELQRKMTIGRLEIIIEQKKNQTTNAREVLRARIDNAKSQAPEDLRELCANLKQEGIEVITWQNVQGRIYGLTYVDMETRISMNGSTLGKEYSAEGMRKYFAQGVRRSPRGKDDQDPVQDEGQEPGMEQERTPSQENDSGQSIGGAITQGETEPASAISYGNTKAQGPQGGAPKKDKEKDIEEKQEEDKKKEKKKPEKKPVKAGKGKIDGDLPSEFNYRTPQILSAVLGYDEGFGQSPIELREEQERNRKRKMGRI
ncbi:MAG: relaxase/mobilization nuclease domain-containing protein [Puia sp.]|nr:relaxase/mobilization nuclease domain-containing protein [Puia sp.]